MPRKMRFYETRELARTLRPQDGLFDSMHLRKGIVTAINTSSPPTLTVTISGDDVEIEGIQYLDTYHPTVDDVVLIGSQGNSLLVVGKVASEYYDPQPRQRAGVVHITPSAANTPTSSTVSGLGLESGITYHAQITPRSSSNLVTAHGYTDLTSSSITIWVTRGNTTTTTLAYFISEEGLVE